MAVAYPRRAMLPDRARYACMIFGAATGVAGLLPALRQEAGIFISVSGLLVGALWFAFGKYGGYPLLETVRNWHPPGNPGAIDEMHRKGLLVIRRRMWTCLTGSALLFFSAGFTMIPLLMAAGHPELVVFAVGVPLGILNSRYFLSRCPRCGYGFFTKSPNRAAALCVGKACGHCGLPLNAYKKR